MSSFYNLSHRKREETEHAVARDGKVITWAGELAKNKPVQSLDATNRSFPALVATGMHLPKLKAKMFEKFLAEA